MKQSTVHFKTNTSAICNLHQEYTQIRHLGPVSLTLRPMSIDCSVLHACRHELRPSHVLHEFAELLLAGERHQVAATMSQPPDLARPASQPPDPSSPTPDSSPTWSKKIKTFGGGERGEPREGEGEHGGGEARGDCGE